MNKKTILFIALLSVFSLNLKAQYTKNDNNHTKWFLNNNFHLSSNLVPENSSYFFQSDLGYKITRKNMIKLDSKAWKYTCQNCIYPYFNHLYKKEKEKFTDYVSKYSLVVSYQLFLYKNLYIGFNVSPLLHSFTSENIKKNNTQFQLPNTYCLNHHIRTFKNVFSTQSSTPIIHRAIKENYLVVLNN